MALTDDLLVVQTVLRAVVLSYTLADVIDANPSVTLSVTCNETDFVEANDVKLIDANSLQLRAKRDGKSKDGRIYSITLTAKDATGNESETMVTVSVPHDQGAANKGLALALTGLASTGKGGVSQITVQSSAPAEASAAVANIAGRHIATLAPQTLQSGLNTPLWNGESAGGTSVPSGRYLVTVTACGTDGTKTHCMIPLQR